jgi:endoglucanase
MGIAFSSFKAVTCALLAAQLTAACCCCPKGAPAIPEAIAPVAGATSTALNPNAPGAVVAIKTCPGPMLAAADGLVDDLEDNNHQVLQTAGRGGYWWASKDEKGSTVEPEGEITMTEGGAGGSKYALRVTGKIATGEGAWGSVVGLRLSQAGLYDASKYAGVSFFAKVGEKSATAVRLKVADVNSHPDGNVCKDGCYNDFGKDFKLSHEWQEYQVSFADMRQQDGWGDPRPPSITPAQLVQIAWLLSTPGTEFDLWLDDIRFLDCQH